VNVRCYDEVLQSGPENIAQGLMHRHFAIICSRIMKFSLECLEKITVYQSMQKCVSGL